MKGKSWLAKLTAFHDGAADPGDEVKVMGVVSLHFSEVFCPVSHNILMDKLTMYSLEK